jgi:hypothetical protein
MSVVFLVGKLCCVIGLKLENILRYIYVPASAAGTGHRLDRGRVGISIGAVSIASAENERHIATLAFDSIKSHS